MTKQAFIKTIEENTISGKLTKEGVKFIKFLESIKLLKFSKK